MVKPKLIPIIYRNMEYPFKIKTRIHEISGNFDQEKLNINDFSYSLHTDSASKKRSFNSKIFQDLKHIKSVSKTGIPRLWHDKNWANDFFVFVDRIIGENKKPEVLEIHPPFINYPIYKNCRLSVKNFDYYKAFVIFLEIFDVFYKQFVNKYTETKIFIENRGSNFDGRFLLSKPSNVLEFASILNDSNSGLKIVLDYPQIFSALYISANMKKKKELQSRKIMIDDEILEKVITFNQDLINYKNVICGIHIWGKLNKGDKWVSHAGNLNDLFSNNDDLKKRFLKSIFSAFNDGIARYFVPEVNSGEKDLHSIVIDMEDAGFNFISKI